MRTFRVAGLAWRVRTIRNDAPDVWFPPLPVAPTVVSSPPRGTGPTLSWRRTAAFTAALSGYVTEVWPLTPSSNFTYHA